MRTALVVNRRHWQSDAIATTRMSGKLKLGNKLACIAALVSNFAMCAPVLAAPPAHHGEFDVELADPDMSSLEVTARCSTGIGAFYRTHDELAAFVEVYAPDKPNTAIAPIDARWPALSGREFHYRVALRAMADALDDDRSAMRRGNAIVLPLSRWLLAPGTPAREPVTMTLRIHGPAGVSFASARVAKAMPIC
jgi:hypothetical protein